MNQHINNLIAATTVLVSTLGSAVQANSATERPNVIFIMTDDQGYPCVGAHGHPWLETPHMDEMHATSVRFDRFMMGSTCAPSRAGIMTGNHSIRNGVTHTIYERERVNLDATTIPEVLKASGYTSGCFGKWHLGDEAAYQPENRGFDEVFIHGAGGIGQAYPGSCADTPKNKYFDPVFKHNGTFVKTKGYCTDVIFDATLGWIKAKKDEEAPFFAYLATNAPHGPFIAPPSYQKKFEDIGFSGKTAGFFGMIEHIDENLGRLFDKLEEWGLTENTIVVFTSDNGMTKTGSGYRGYAGRPQVRLTPQHAKKAYFSYNANMKGLKGTVHEGGVRAPFFVHWGSKFQQGKTVNTVASYLDILPTLADLAGAPLPNTQEFEGRSLTPLLFEENPVWEDRYLFQHVTRWDHKVNPDDYKWKQFSVRSQKFRLVETELYDMEKDPNQTVDVSDQYPELVADMRKQYEAFWDEVRPLMINENVPLAKERPFHVDYFAQKKARGIPLWAAPEL